MSSRRAGSRGGRSLGLVACLAVLGAAASLLVASPRPAGAAGPSTTTGPSCPASNPPDELTLSAGTPQTAKLDSPFAAPFQVVLANSNGCPVTTAVAGTTVTFSAPASGSTTASGVFASSGSSSVTVGTDANGSAQAPAFAANDIAGSYTVTASSSYGSVSFALTNTAAGVAATIAAQAPVSEAAFTDATYNRPLQVVVLDANGNPVAGTEVTFTLGSAGAGSGGGSAAAAAGASFAGGESQSTELTNASGVAISPPLTANGTPGRFTATASTAGVREPASFQLDNVAGKPPRVTLSGLARRAAVVDTRYAEPLRVEVVDATGKPVQGAQVTFTLGASGGASGGAGVAVPGASFLGGASQATETTGARGRASSPLFTANATAGKFTATIAVSGSASPLTLTLDNLAGRPPRIEPLDPPGAATIGSRYSRPLEVRVLDAAGKPVQGATVTFSLGSGAAAGGGGGSASGGPGASFLGGAAQATETTTAAGLASSPLFTANTTPGTFTATAASAGATNPAMFRLDNLAARLAPIGTSDPPRSATVGGRFPSPLEVRVVATNGAPVQGATVTFTLGASGGGANAAAGAAASFLGGGTQATETTNGSGRAVSPPLTANTSAGAFTATAALAGTTEVTSFALRNLAGKPTTISAGAAATEQTTAGTRFPIRLAVTVADKHNNPVTGVPVRFSAPAHGPSGRFPHGRHSVLVRTNAAGIAVAPVFTAGASVGGYVVKAAAEGSSATAAFALVNQAPGQAP